MLPENRTPTHPGEILRLDFLEPLGVTPAALARHLGLPAKFIADIANGAQGVTPEVAWSLAGALGTTPDFWISLQTKHDLARTRPATPVQPLAVAN